MRDIYAKLLEFYGPQGWWPVIPAGGSTPEYRGGPRNARERLEVAIGAVLAQNTSWLGARRALENLHAAGWLDFQPLARIPEVELAPRIRPSGYFNQKARRIKILVSFIEKRYGPRWENFFGEPADKLRRMLLDLDGIGPETADSIVLYAAGQPSFVIDSYTRRLLYRLGLAPLKISYEELKGRFEKELSASAELYGEYHALIVIHSKERCTARKPLCQGCPLAETCARQGLE